MAAAAALVAMLAGVGPFLGLTQPPWSVPAWRAAFLLGIFAAAVLWEQALRRRLLPKMLAIFALSGAVALEPDARAWLHATLLAPAAQIPTWLRAFWYGIAEPPSPAAGIIIYGALAWFFGWQLWRVACGRATWYLWLALGSLPAVVLWLYEQAEIAIVTQIAFFTCMLLLTAARPSLPPGTPVSGTVVGTRWLSGLLVIALVVPTALALPAYDARPWPGVRERVQRYLPLTARGPGVGFGGLSQTGSPYDPLSLGGPFRPDRRTLLEVTIPEPEDGPLPSRLYLRGVVRTRYDGTTFASPEPSRRLRPRVASAEPGEIPSTTVTQHIRVGDFQTDVLYAAAPAQRVVLADGRYYGYDAENTLRTRRTLLPGDTYTVVSRVDLPDEDSLADRVAPWPDLRQLDLDPRYLALPERVPERVGQLARSLAEGTRTPYEAAKRIEAHLRKYPYRTDVPFTPPGRDFVDYFLFDLRTGYCVYYASAMVVLLREVGIPARMIQGFVIELNGPGRYQVTGAQAHTWVEAYLPGYGWYPFEPTPAYPAVNRPGQTGPGTAETAADEGFDVTAEDISLGLPIPTVVTGDEATPSPGEPEAGGVAANGRAITRAITWVAAGMASALVLVSSIRYLRRILRRRRQSERERIAEIYEWCRNMVVGAAWLDPRVEARVLAEDAPALTPAEFAGRAGRLWPSLAMPIGILAEQYSRAAYAPADHQLPAVDCPALARRVAQGLRNELGRRRYLLARLTAYKAGVRPTRDRDGGQPSSQRSSMGTYFKPFSPT